MRPAVFVRRYKAQLSFCLVLIVFLAASVGEGQAYDVGQFDYSNELDSSSQGFIGKPQIFAGQTILTGEVQQSVAIIYKVEKGDTMSTIASRYNLSVGTILDANNMKPLDPVKIGSQLIIPAEDTNTSLAWLESINAEKERQLKLAEQQRQKQLAQLGRNSRTSTSTRYVSYGDYTIIGRRKGSYNGGYPGQCTWLVNDYYNFPGTMGNGGQYLASARKYGLKTGDSPRNGAVIVTRQSFWGHVGIVKSVSGGKVLVEDMNYAGPYIVTQHYYDANDPVIKGYIYM